MPYTIVHGDFHTKNLVHDRGSITPVDWGSAYLSPHLGDLYSLICDATDVLDDDAVQELKDLYVQRTTELGGEDQTAISLEWQLLIGGLCFDLRSLCWVVEEGIHSVPVSESWIDDLVSDIDKLSRVLGTKYS